MIGWRLSHQFFVALFMISCIGIVVDASRVILTDNGYNNLVVAISYETPITQSETIINNLQKMISDASPVLYKATGDRLHFRSVHILIPESWTHIDANISTWETFNTADVIVDTPNPLHEDTPYTKHDGKCGERGERIHLTPHYLATLLEEQNQVQYGKPGKVFVHEWAHYRYGVFDEYGTAGGKYPLFYRKSGSSSIVPNICSNNPAIFTVRDITNNATKCQNDSATGIYNENCRYVLGKYFTPLTSLTSHHQLESVVHFCKDDQERAHMTDAPNEHNARCGGASTWSVIMRNPDFAENKNKNVAFKMMPTQFRIIKSAGSRFVVVMDTSGSMKEFDRIVKLGESVRTWIKNDFPIGNQLGMVKFSSSADIVSDLKLISDFNSREEMMRKVPKDLGVATCIGCGLELAIQMLKEGGIIVLVTDGKNSPGYLSISDVENEIIQANIRVITVAFGREADTNIEHLADITGGKSYFIKDEDSSEALLQAFSGSCTFQSNVKNNDLIFKLFEQVIVAGESKLNFEDVVEVDPTVGRNLKLSVFNLENKDNLESIELKGPDGDITNNFDFDTSTATVTVVLAKVGPWGLRVHLKSPQLKNILVTVTTQLRLNVTTHIKTECHIPNGADIRNANEKGILIQANVLKGSHPITGASIKAYIVKPNEEMDILELLDNGVNADTTQGDGVYSKYYIHATQAGRYTVKCQVTSNDKALERLGFIGSANPPSLLGEEKKIEDDKRIPMQRFTRIVTGGSFQVEIPVSNYDSYPPGRVTDLSVVVVNDTAANISIVLKWTAPGDDLDEGTVSYYELKYSDVVADVINSNFDDDSPIRKSRSIITEDDLVSGSLQPNDAGSLQMATFQLTHVEREKPYYLSLRAMDKAEKAGQVSNLAIFFIPDESAFVLTRTTEDESWREVTDQGVIHIHVNSQEPGYHFSSVLGLAVGLISIVCFSVALLMVVLKQTHVYRFYDGIPA